MRTLFTAAALAGLLSGVIEAQGLTPAECQAALTALAIPKRDMEGWERVAECGTTAGQALASALTSARLETDTIYLANLWTAAAAIRDPNVFNAAVAIARDRSASSAARVANLIIALAQHVRGVAILGGGFGRLTSVRWGANCAFTVSTHDVPGSLNAMPPNYVQALAAMYDEVGWSSGENPIFAAIARCARVVLRSDVPELVDPALISVSYVCGTKYRVTNTSPKPVTVTYRVFHVLEAGDLPVPSNGSRDFFTVFPYAIQLEYDGQVIREAQNGATTCPP